MTTFSNNRFGIWKHRLKQIWVTKELKRPQKRPSMVLYVKFFQPYIQYPVCAWSFVRSHLFLVLLLQLLLTPYCMHRRQKTEPCLWNRKIIMGNNCTNTWGQFESPVITVAAAWCWAAGYTRNCGFL